MAGSLVLMAGCGGEPEQDVRREGVPLADSIRGDSTLPRGDSMMARDTATPR